VVFERVNPPERPETGLLEFLAFGFKRGPALQPPV
jgi:hypothetical protein